MSKNKTNKNKKNTSLREKLLISILGVSLVVGGYLILRIKPQQTIYQVLEEQLSDSRQTLSSTRPHRASAHDTQHVIKEVVELKKTIKQAEKTLAGIEGRFINLASQEAIADMRSKLTGLAQSENLRVASVTQSDQDLSLFTKQKQQELADFLARPLFNLKLYGQYHDLLSFIQNLDGLPNRVVVTKLSINTQSHQFQSASGRRSLEILLTLSF